MIRSGIVPIDQLSGGFQPRRSYLLTGGAGSGKTMYSLLFADQGLRSGERVMLLTHATREDLLSHADHLGVDLRAAIRDDSAIVLRYRPDFARRLVRAGSADNVFEDLRRVLEEYRPRRVAIDTFAPLLEDGSASPVAAATLAELLELAQTTSLLTYSNDLANAYDRRLEPLVQSAAGIFRIIRDERGACYIEVVSLRTRPSATSKAAEVVEPLTPAGQLPNEPKLVAPLKVV